jgi:hypothetical protein
MGWNKNYLIALQNVKPINGLNIDTTETLNVILDKINQVGLDYYSNRIKIFRYI